MSECNEFKQIMATKLQSYPRTDVPRNREGRYFGKLVMPATKSLASPLPLIASLEKIHGFSSRFLNWTQHFLPNQHRFGNPWTRTAKAKL